MSDLESLFFDVIWWGRLGSNQRPSGYEPPALTPELRPQGQINMD